MGNDIAEQSFNLGVLSAGNGIDVSVSDEAGNYIAGVNLTISVGANLDSANVDRDKPVINIR